MPRSRERTALSRRNRSGHPTRVLCVEVNEDGTVGGSHQALYDLVKGLDRERFEPVVLFYQDNPFSDRLRELGVEVHTYERERERELEVRLRGHPLSKALDILFGAVLRRTRFLRRHSIGLLHLNNSPGLGFNDWLPAARLASIPCVVSAMIIAPHGEGPVKRALMRGFDAVIPVSRYILEDWAAAVGIPRKRMHVVHHGVDLEAFRARVSRTPEDVRAELGVPPGHALAVMVGNIREWKGQHVVLEALALLDEGVRNRLYTVFAGGAGDQHGAYLSRLRELVEGYGLQECVSFLGPRSDAPNLLNAADIAIHASVRPEPGGIAVLEAMAVGAAVVAADVGGHTEVLTADSGFTFDTTYPQALAEHLVHLVESEELRRRVGEKAKERMEEFSVERNVHATQDVYEAVLA
jgi:glycosyltransferase involved in cell wall biosynthesis